MRLQDRVAQETQPVWLGVPGRGAFAVPGPASIAACVRDAPVRYVLDDDVAAVVVGAVFRDTAQIIASLDMLRIHAPLMWIEWNERGALAAMASAGICAQPDSVRAARVGLLVRSAPCGRKGEIFVVWEGEAGAPDLAPMRILFDLDDPTFAAQSDKVLTRVIPVPEEENLTHLLSFARFELAAEWVRYIDAACAAPGEREEAIARNLTMVAAEFPFVVAFCLIMSARGALTLRPSALSRLNGARVRSGKAALLEHVEVTAQLGGRAAAGRGAPSMRSQARLHFVCGHFVRRAGRIFWRRSHLRGNAVRGAIAARTISVRVDRRHAAP